MASLNDQIPPVLRKHPVSAICGVVIVVLLVVLYFRSGAADEVRARLDEQSELGKKLNNNITYGTQLREQLAEVTAANSQVAQRAVKVGELATNLGYFYRLESELGIQLLDLRPLASPAPAKNAPKTTYGEALFAVSVSGDYRQMIEFLRQMENGQYFCRISEATLTRRADVPNKLTLTLKVGLLAQ